MKKNKLSHIVIAWILIILCPITIYGMFIEFIPSDIANDIAEHLSILFTIAVFVFGLKTMTAKYLSKINILRVCELLFRVLLLKYTFSLLFAYGIPGLYTRILGEDDAHVQIVQPRKNYGSRECRFVIENEYTEHSRTGYLCISEASFETEDQVYIISGRKSKLGFYVRASISDTIFREIIKDLKSE